MEAKGAEHGLPPAPSQVRPVVKPSPGTPNQDYVTHAEQKLTGMFFSGNYVDRIFVDPVSAYRDRIVVDPEESVPIRALRSVHKKAKRALPQFVGIQSK